MASRTEEEEEFNYEIQTCASCRNDAKHHCPGCYKAPDFDGQQLYTTWYCSPECQAQDHKPHKWGCKAAQARRSVCRAGIIAQSAFYMYLERLFDVGITKVEEKGNDLYLHQGKNDQNLLMPFPGKIFSSDEDKYAALTVLACGNALGFVHAVLETMLPGVVTKIARVDHTLKSPNRRVILIDSSGSKTDNTTQSHAIIQATFPSGEAFAINITGAQHGHYNPVIPWHVYANERVLSIIAVKPLQSLQEYKKQVGKGAKEVVMKTREEKFAEVWLAAMKAWESKNGSLDAMLKSREGLFEGMKADLLKLMDEYVQKQKVVMEKKRKQ